MSHSNVSVKGLFFIHRICTSPFGSKCDRMRRFSGVKWAAIYVTCLPWEFNAAYRDELSVSSRGSQQLPFNNTRTNLKIDGKTTMKRTWRRQIDAGNDQQVTSSSRCSKGHAVSAGMMRAGQGKRTVHRCERERRRRNVLIGSTASYYKPKKVP